MSSAWAWAGVALAGAAGWLLLRKKPQELYLPTPAHRSALIGDSLAEGLGAPLAKALAPVSLAVRARVGARAKDFASGKYRDDLEAVLLEEPEVTFVSLGTNDSAAGGTGFAKDFKSVGDRIRARGSTPVFLGPPELPWPRGEVWSAADAAGTLVKAPSGLAHAPDGVHLTPEGYSNWAKFIGKTLRGGVSDVSSIYDALEGWSI